MFSSHDGLRIQAGLYGDVIVFDLIIEPGWAKQIHFGYSLPFSDIKQEPKTVHNKLPIVI